MRRMGLCEITVGWSCGQAAGCLPRRGRVGHQERKDKDSREDPVHWRALAALVTAAFIASDAGAQPLGIGTNPQGTMVYTLGATLSKALLEHAHMQSRVQPSSGTGTMVPLVNAGEIDIGFCNAREFYDAFHGVGSSDKRPNPNLRTMAVLFPLQVGLIVRNDSPIKSTKDLKGRTISYGYASQEVIRILLDA